jgi:UDP-3-O-[3-hydroxymyristoyl] glucosamine N-acyltransferase
MSELLEKKISLQHLADTFGLRIIGDSSDYITQIGTKFQKSDKGLYWAKTVSFLESTKTGNVLCSEEVFNKSSTSSSVNYLIFNGNSRLLFSKIINAFFIPEVFNDENNYVEIHRANEFLKIGSNVFIGKDVVIGKGTKIQNNVVIRQKVVIGENCLIKDNTTIATEGLSHDYDPETDLYFKLPQIGGVIVEDFVEIGPNSTVRRSALDNTIIGRGTRIGSLCNIGHNVIIGKNCTFISHVIAGGSSIFGENVFVGMGASVKNGLTIGSNSTIGQGAIVVKNVPEHETWVGNPAKKIK